MPLHEYYKYHPGMSIALMLYIVVLLADFASTLLVGELVPYLETNPLYSTLGLFGIFLINCLILSIVILAYGFCKDHYMRFIILLAVITFTIVRLIAVINNIQIGLNPPSLEEAKAISQAAKLDAVKNFILLNIIPFIIGVITFILYKLEYKIKEK